MSGTRIVILDTDPKTGIERCLLTVSGWQIPAEAKLVEAYETPTEFVICGWPAEDDPNHDCDAMGCTSISHVLLRVKKGSGPIVVDGAPVTSKDVERVQEAYRSVSLKLADAERRRNDAAAIAATALATGAEITRDRDAEKARADAAERSLAEQRDSNLAEHRAVIAERKRADAAEAHLAAEIEEGALDQHTISKLTDRADKAEREVKRLTAALDMADRAADLNAAEVERLRGIIRRIAKVEMSPDYAYRVAVILREADAPHCSASNGGEK